MSPKQLSLLVCEICGEPGAEHALVRYKELGKWRFDWLPRCRDRDACRGRCLMKGLEYWPIDVVGGS